MRSYYDSFASIAQATSYTTKLLLGWQDLPIRLPVCVRIPTTVNHVENAAATLRVVDDRISPLRQHRRHHELHHIVFGSLVMLDKLHPNRVYTVRCLG